MKSLLILTPRFPYPVIGGDRLRIYQVCKVLSANYRLTLLSLCDKLEEMSMPIPDDGIFHSVERIFLPRWRSWLNCAFALTSDEPLQVAYYRHREFRHRAAALMREHDGALAHLIRVGDAIKDEPGIKFLEMTDAISLNYERIRKTNHSNRDLRAHIFAFEAKRLRKFETTIADYFDHNFLVSEIDRQFLFSGQPERLARVSVCSNGVDLSALPFNFEQAGQDIIFIGNMVTLQNFDAAWFMAADVLPLIRTQRPATKLRLIGRISPEHAARLAALKAVEVTGEVEDVAIAARGGGVGVCPMRLGAGVQNKVLEYMALGLPTVSTQLGLEGFEAVSGRDLLVADDAKGIAAAVVKLLEDRDAAREMAQCARAFVEAHHSWGFMLNSLMMTINTHISKTT